MFFVIYIPLFRFARTRRLPPFFEQILELSFDTLFYIYDLYDMFVCPHDQVRDEDGNIIKRIVKKTTHITRRTRIIRRTIVDEYGNKRVVEEEVRIHNTDLFDDTCFFVNKGQYSGQKS